MKPCVLPLGNQDEVPGQMQMQLVGPSEGNGATQCLSQAIESLVEHGKLSPVRSLSTTSRRWLLSHPFSLGGEGTAFLNCVCNRVSTAYDDTGKTQCHSC